MAGNHTGTSSHQNYCHSVSSLANNAAASNPTAATLFHVGNQSSYPSLWAHHPVAAPHHTENDWNSVIQNGLRTTDQKYASHSADMTAASNNFNSRGSLQSYWQFPGTPATYQTSANSSLYGHSGYTSNGVAVGPGGNLFSNSAGNALWSTDFSSSVRRCSPGDLRSRPYGSELLNPLDLEDAGELPTSDDLEQFAKQFKQRRIKLGKSLLSMNDSSYCGQSVPQNIQKE